jgi:hypothetical protein
MSNKGTVVRITDQRKKSIYQERQVYECSRCGKLGIGARVVIKPKWIRETRQGGKIYIYHIDCINTNKIELRINYTTHTLAFYWSRLKRKITLLALIVEWRKKGYKKNRKQ